MFKFLLLIFFLMGLTAAASHTQAKISEFSLVNQRTLGEGENPRVFFRGDNIEVTGNFNALVFPRVCRPCAGRDQNLQFGNNYYVSGNNMGGVSGTINGVFYPQLFVGRGFFLAQQDQNVRIPVRWSKIVRVYAPMTMTGSIGFWTNRDDVDRIDRAVFYQVVSNFVGGARLSLFSRVVADGDTTTRNYSDKDLSYTFTAQAE